MQGQPAVAVVSKLLAAHAPVDEREAASLRRILTLLEHSPAPFSRDHFIPGHLTASALVATPERERTLLVYHAKLEMWVQPGGHFEPGECDPSSAAAREVLEETHLSARWPGLQPVLWDVDVHVIPAHKADPAHEHHDLRMLLLAEPGAQRAGDGVKQAEWFTRAQCAKMDLDPGLVRALKKVFASA